MNRPYPEVMTATTIRPVAATARPRPGSVGTSSSSSSAPRPSAVAPTKPIWIPQNRFSNPLPKSSTTSAIPTATAGKVRRRTSR